MRSPADQKSNCQISYFLTDFAGSFYLLIAVSNITKVDQSEGGGGGTSLTIADAKEILGDVRLGDSINVNGLLAFYNTFAQCLESISLLYLFFFQVFFFSFLRIACENAREIKCMTYIK